MSDPVLRPRSAPGVPLADLLPGASGHVSGVSLDSRHVLPGDLYVGLAGARTHGARFADQAARAGAVALLTDAEGSTLAGSSGLPVISVADPRAVMADLAARVYGRPSDAVALFGITGTNGKTSTTFLLEAALAALGRTVGTIGTIGFRVGAQPVAGARTTITTPESPDLQALLAVMVESGADAVAMEVSSHALALNRVDGLTFDAAAFTMLGQDHLEFHGTQEDYFHAKAQLFLGGRSASAVVNTADPWGVRLAELIRADGGAQLITTFGPEADVRVLASSPLPTGGATVEIGHPGGRTAFTLAMLGDFNVANAVTALALVAAQGLDVDAAAAGFAEAQVPGRMQRLDLGPDAPHVVVDFAHTPQAVAAALAALPRTGRRIAVLGAGGDRDPSKRAPMGRAAAQASDIVIVTDDNPRSEDPALIRAAVAEGALSVTGAEVIDGGDRGAAIARALQLASPGDWVAVLGKGHETGQDIGGTITPFDDVAVLRASWGG